MRNIDIEKVTIKNIIEYLELMSYMGWANNTIFRKAECIKGFIEYAHLNGYCKLNPLLVPIPEKEFKIPRVADDESYRDFFNAIGTDRDPKNVRNRALISLLWDSGMRIGELLSIDVDDLDLEKNKALIRTEKAKTKRPIREVFWSQETGKHIRKWLVRRESLLLNFRKLNEESVFIAVNGQKRGDRLHVSSLRGTFNLLSDKAGLEPRLNPHSFRHHMGVKLAKQGANNSIISNILGHSDLGSSYVYTMLFDKNLEEEYHKFNKG